MSDQNMTKDSLDINEFDKPKLPSMLNVLTILTFIGCGLFALLTLGTPMFLSFSKNMIEKAQSSGKDLSAKEAADIQKGLAQIELSEANMIPLIIIGMAGIILCFVGALMMRKLKKDGFWIYIAGQAVPIIGNSVLIGVAQYKELGSIFMLTVVAVFIILYATQRKYFVY